MIHQRYIDRELYFNEMSLTTEKYIIPWLAKFIRVEGIDILEIGCGEGGNLKPFIQLGCSATGVDLLPERIAQAEAFLQNNVPLAKVRLIQEDILNLKAKDIGTFDLVILKDFIEHVNQQPILEHLRSYLKPNGAVFIGFPPWMMPYGGHQQICRTYLGKLPWIHLLPEPAFIRFLKLAGENQQVINHLCKDRRTGISIERLKELFKSNSYDIVSEELYFINPGYEVKYGLKPRRRIPILSHIPIVRNFVTTCYYALIRPTSK